MTEQSTPLRALYFDDAQDAVAKLTRAVGAADGDQLQGALRHLPQEARRAVIGQVGSAAAGLLEVGLADVLGLAWGKYAALRRAAQETAADRMTEQLVGLATHRVTFTHEPAVEVHVANLPPAEIGLELELKLRIRGLIAVVRAGRLTAIRAGQCAGSGTLAFAGQEVASRKVDLDLPAALRLGTGIPLLAESVA